MNHGKAGNGREEMGIGMVQSKVRKGREGKERRERITVFYLEDTREEEAGERMDSKHKGKRGRETMDS